MRAKKLDLHRPRTTSRARRRSLMVFLASVLGSGACAPEPGAVIEPSRSGARGGSNAGGSNAGGAAGGGAAGGINGGTGAAGQGGTPAPVGGAGGQPAGAADSGVVDAPGASPGSDAQPLPPVGPPVALPIVVTEHFPNRGWFGDGGIAMHFKAGASVIKESVSVTGPCATRVPGARGKCLQFTYTPPAGYAAPAKGGFIGVYFLPTLRTAHPQQNARAGDPNWGLEPGVPVMPGARRLSFVAAAADAGTRMAFRGGIDKDAVYLPEATAFLGAQWSKHEIPLAGGSTGPALLGGFAWTWKDTGKPVTFYVDNILWEAEGHTPPEAPMGSRDGKRELVVINNCAEPVWVGIGSQMAVPEGGGFRLDAKQRKTVVMPSGFWSGRLWGRTGCTFDAGGTGRCDTGDCGGRLGCGAVGGKTPATLAEITWSAGEPNPDFYDISLVDGYNLPMAMAPLRGSHGRNPGAPWDCLTPSCVADLNATCPGELRVQNAAGRVVGCMSACEKFQSDQFCCKGAHNQPETCPPFDFSKTFKAACPTSYSYAYDDATSTFTCKGEDYAVWFCP